MIFTCGAIAPWKCCICVRCQVLGRRSRHARVILGCHPSGVGRRQVGVTIFLRLGARSWAPLRRSFENPSQSRCSGKRNSRWWNPNQVSRRLDEVTPLPTQCIVASPRVNHVLEEHRFPATKSGRGFRNRRWQNRGGNTTMRAKIVRNGAPPFTTTVTELGGDGDISDEKTYGSIIDLAVPHRDSRL